MKVNKNMVSGNTAMLILKLISEKDMYGYLESYNQEANGKLRKYYRITPNGKKYLEKMIEEWNAYANAVTSMIQYSV
ncbi:PadR family transcriptional regulator [Dorea longicatena]|uniref:PadR family transcriptional regulator n=1 Tax=Dorea longicatena TaxID=88431 RepID=UPI0011114EAE|nr:PadR family transcriptional regulator [Dorea longicatena]